jgi:ATP-dependent helicase/nuclease subunit A
MTGVHHELIRASAGTGKTYQLTNRYLRLLFLTEAPERIIALTFTRKAAAEFFEKIFHRLACAAGDEQAAASLGRDIGLPASTIISSSTSRSISTHPKRSAGGIPD